MRGFTIYFGAGPSITMQVLISGTEKNGESLNFSMTRQMFYDVCEKYGLPKLGIIPPNVASLSIFESFYFPSQVIFKDGTQAPIKTLGIPLSTFIAYINNADKFLEEKYAGLDQDFFPFKKQVGNKLFSANAANTDNAEEKTCCLHRCTIL